MKKRCDWLLRSMMFVPGHNEKLLNKSVTTSADALIIDLEDSVQPFENKKIARDNLSKFQNQFINCDKKIFVRINDRDSAVFLEDVISATIDGINALLIPKVFDRDDIIFIDNLLNVIEKQKNVVHGTFKIAVLIETAAAVLNVQEICKASDRVIAVCFGCEDFITDLEGYHDDEHESIYIPRSLVSLGARACGVIPIDTVHIDVHNLDDLKVMLEVGIKFGFEGQLVLSPKELPLVHLYYSPIPSEVCAAEEMLEMYEEAKKEQKGVTVYNGKFVGPPMVEAAKKILERHKKCKKKI